MTEEKSPEQVPTRGEGQPMTRGGNGQPMTRGGKNPDERKRLEMMKKQRDEFNKKVTRGELAGIVNGFNQNILGMTVRLEALNLALSRMEHGEEFKEMFRDSRRRVIEWRATVGNMQRMNLRQFRDMLVLWNSDQENPEISASCFDPEYLDKFLSEQNPDTSLTAEEREELQDMLFKKVLEDALKKEESITEPPQETEAVQ